MIGFHLEPKHAASVYIKSLQNVVVIVPIRLFICISQRYATRKDFPYNKTN
jgi:hypothetical protein